MSYQQNPNPNFQPLPVYQQPMVTPGMQVVAGGNRNAKNLPVEAGGREWSNGLFDCCDDAGTCKSLIFSYEFLYSTYFIVGVLAWCCPCVVYSQNKRRLEHLSQKGYPDPEHGGCSSGDCFVHGLITGCCGLGWILQVRPHSNSCSVRGLICLLYSSALVVLLGRVIT